MKFDILYQGEPIRIDVSAEGSRYRLQHDGKSMEFECLHTTGGLVSILMDGRSFAARVQSSPPAYYVQVQDLSYEYEVLEGGGGEAVARQAAHGTQRIVAPMPGKVAGVLRQPGDRIAQGDGIVIVEAMKMQNELRAAREGVVKEIRVSPGDTVEAGTVVAVIESAS